MSVPGDNGFQWGQPAWTAVMYPPSSGIDPLGPATVSRDRILPELSTGINVLTRHLRYWSFYTWLLPGTMVFGAVAI